MNNDSEEAFKNLLRKAGGETPGPRFTESVMRRIDAEALQSAALEPALKTLLQRHTLETPPVGFTRTVMARAGVERRPEAPLLAPWVWYVAAAVVGLLLGLGVFVPPKSQPASRAFPEVSRSVTALSQLLSAIPPLYVLGLCVLCGLLALDYFFRYKALKIGQ